MVSKGVNAARIIFYFVLAISLSAFQQAPNIAEKVSCEEVLFSLQYKSLEASEIKSLYCGETIYISVNSLFEYLRIKFEDPVNRTITGFFPDPDASFQFNVKEGYIIYLNEKTSLDKSQLFYKADEIFMNPLYLEKIFGLKLEYQLSALSWKLRPEITLPYLKILERQKMRDKIYTFRKKIDADTLYKPGFSFFDLGRINYEIRNVRRSDKRNNTVVSLGGNSNLLGGELTYNFRYNSQIPVSNRNMFYLWRKVFDDQNFLTGLKIGRIYPGSISSIFNPVNGIEVSNKSISNRKDLGHLTLTEYTHPNWEVELYINNIFVDFSKADDLGKVTFEVPINYGNTLVTLKAFGPWGETEIIKKNYRTPQILLPKKAIEYTLKAGKVQDSIKSNFMRFNLDYGLTNAITIGGGLEYLSSNSRRFFPYFKVASRVSPSISFFSRYAPGVRLDGNFRYANTTSGLTLDVEYENLENGQDVIKYSYDEKRNLRMSLPVNLRIFKGSANFRFQQIMRNNYHFTNMEMIFSGTIWGVNSRISSGIYSTTYNKPLVYSNVGISLAPWKELLILPEIRYEYLTSEISSARIHASTPISKKGFLNFSYDHNFKYNQYYIQAGINFNLKFGKFGTNASYFNKIFLATQTFSGSLSGDLKNGFDFDSANKINTSEIAFRAFLDLNLNNNLDPNEPVIPEMDIAVIKSPGAVKNKADNQILYTGIRPYLKHLFKIETGAVPNIAWKVNKSKIAVQMNPGEKRIINIPFQVVGEINGSLMSESKQVEFPMSINLINKHTLTSIKIHTDKYGYFEYIGLSNGEYKISLNNGKYRLTGHNEFKIKNGLDGAIIQDVKLEIKKREGS